MRSAMLLRPYPSVITVSSIPPCGHEVGDRNISEREMAIFLSYSLFGDEYGYFSLK